MAVDAKREAHQIQVLLVQKWHDAIRLRWSGSFLHASGQSVSARSSCREGQNTASSRNPRRGGFFPRSGAPRLAFLSLARSFGLQTQQTDLQGVVLLVFCIELLGNYHLQGLVLLVFCIKLLGNYHLQGLVLLVFCIKLLGNYRLQGLALLVFCIKLLGKYHLQGLVLLVFCIKLLGNYHLQGLVLLVFCTKLPIAGSCFACVLHQAIF